ncbi:exported hypothetical protein [Verrucomicrobia bacterium]|nr:exported hypothetical protein [Verrucomicrobiota bacterium]
MKTNRNRSNLGLSILAGGLSFVGAANAVDLIVNGSFENPNGGEWKYFNTYNYSSAYFTGPPVPASENPGTIWSWQHASYYGAWTNFVTPMAQSDFLQNDLIYADAQTVKVTNALPGTAIDAGLGRYSFSAWLASYGQPNSNPEQPFVVLRYFDDATNQVGTDLIFDRTINTFAVTYADPAKGTNVPTDLSQDHDWVKFAATGNVPPSARLATVYITRSPNAGLSGTPDTYVDLVKLNVINANDTTVLETAAPADGQLNVAPNVVLTVGLRDISTHVDTNSIRFSFDGVAVTPGIQESGTLTTVQYQPPALLAPFSAHSYQIAWADNGTPVTSKTNLFAFTVGAYLNLTLGPPLYLETFDEVAEGALPAGWSVTNATDTDIPGADLNNFHSDSYLDWVVISRSTLSNLFAVVPGGADYVSTVNVAPNQFVNGVAVTNLIDTNFIFAASSDRFGNQIQYLFTGDYNLSGQANVYLSFHSIYTQNQNSLGAVEYSIDGGATWLPALYMLDGPDIFLDALGHVDASNSFAYVHADVPPLPGNYGAYIGVAQSQWANLGPFLSARVNDDLVESKRVELIRLVQADNQATVRFRFTQVGQNSYYFGIDDFGLYSLNAGNQPVISSVPASQTVAVGNMAQFSVGALGAWPFAYQWRHSGTNLPGSTSQHLVIPAVQLSAAGAYDVVVSNSAGSATSSPPAVLTVLNPPVFVTGQWDFNGNLAATYGSDLQYYDSSVQATSSFNTTTGFGISDINGVPVTVMKFTPTSGNSGNPGANPTTDAWGGYQMFHHAAANGGGTNVNQYTLIFDILYPSSSDLSWRSLLQASPTVATGGDDAEFYINQSDGIGISSIYDGDVTPDVWHRIALGVDLAGPGTHPVVTKFIDGVKVGEQTGGLSGVDGRFSLLTSLALLLAEDNGYNNDGYVSSVQFSNGRRPDAFIEALGGPSPSKIPGVIVASRAGAQVVITWTGGVPLQSASSLAGPWTTVNGATSPYTVPNPTTARFYRPQIP